MFVSPKSTAIVRWVARSATSRDHKPSDSARMRKSPLEERGAGYQATDALTDLGLASRPATRNGSQSHG
jgi:hypothetical protein